MEKKKTKKKAISGNPGSSYEITPHLWRVMKAEIGKEIERISITRTPRVSNVRKIHFDVILDLDRIEEIQNAMDTESMDDNYFAIGLREAFRRIERTAGKGMNDYSCGDGTYWEIPEDGIKIRWEIDYLNYTSWSDIND